MRRQPATPQDTATPTLAPTASPAPVSTDGAIPQGVTVNGVGLDGMTQDDARIALTNGLPDASIGKLTDQHRRAHDRRHLRVGEPRIRSDATIQAAFASAGGPVNAVTT